MIKVLCLTFLVTITSLSAFSKESSALIMHGKRERPLYEIGAGILYSKFPNYPGASSSKQVVLPFPNLIYRGEKLRLKREEGARGIFYNGENVEIDISFDGTLSSDADDTEAREGMPKLDTLIEFGPRFLYNIAKVTDSNPWDFDFHLAGRIAFSTGLFKNLHARGLVVNPFLTVRRVSLFTDDDLFAASASIKYATMEWHEYYYSVNQRFATESRPFYKSKSGLAELSYALFYNYPIKNDFYTFAGGIHSFYSQSANKESPLLTQNSNITFVLGIYWNFHKSKQKVLD